MWFCGCKVCAGVFPLGGYLRAWTDEAVFSLENSVHVVWRSASSSVDELPWYYYFHRSKKCCTAWGFFQPSMDLSSCRPVGSYHDTTPVPPSVGSLVCRNPKEGLDGGPFVTGLSTLLHQFHKEHTEVFLMVLAQYIKTQIVHVNYGSKFCVYLLPCSASCCPRVLVSNVWVTKILCVSALSPCVCLVLSCIGTV